MKYKNQTLSALHQKDGATFRTRCDVNRSKSLKERVIMYSRSNREATFVRVKSAATATDGDGAGILEKAIALVKRNSPEHRYLIDRLIATVRLLPSRQQDSGPDEGLMNYTDRPQAIARTVLDSLRYKI